MMTTAEAWKLVRAHLYDPYATRREDDLAGAIKVLDTAHPVAAAPPAFVVPFDTAPPVVLDAAGAPLRPLCVVIGGVIPPGIDTNEKIAGLLKPEPALVRHRTERLASPPTRVVGDAEGRMSDTGEVVGDAIARILFEPIVGFSPGAIAEEVGRRIVAAFAAKAAAEVAESARNLDPE